jgi:hypothetical protein
VDFCGRRSRFDAVKGSKILYLCKAPLGTSQTISEELRRETRGFLDDVPNAFASGHDPGDAIDTFTCVKRHRLEIVGHDARGRICAEQADRPALCFPKIISGRTDDVVLPGRE